MIEVNELRIGNFVFAGTDENDHQQAGKVLQIFEGVINWSFDLNQKSVNDGYNVTDLEYVDPIPLTPEWMERFGFSVYGNIYSKNAEMEFAIEVKDDEFYPVIIGFMEPVYYSNPLKFVHQLQNLYYALTSTELIIHL